MFFGDVDHALVILPGGQVTGRVMREVHDEQFGVGLEVAFQEVRVEPPGMLFFWFPIRDLAAQSGGDLIQGLVAGKGAEHMVAGVQNRAEGEENAFLRHDDQTVAGRAALV